MCIFHWLSAYKSFFFCWHLRIHVGVRVCLCWCPSMGGCRYRVFLTKWSGPPLVGVRLYLDGSGQHSHKWHTESSFQVCLGKNIQYTALIIWYVMTKLLYVRLFSSSQLETRYCTSNLSSQDLKARKNFRMKCAKQYNDYLQWCVLLERDCQQHKMLGEAVGKGMWYCQVSWTICLGRQPVHFDT